MAHFELTTAIDAPVERCFDLSRDIGVHVASMFASRERAVGPLTGGLIGLGDEVAWEAWHLGLRWRMRSQITEFERPTLFVDEMLQGPFASFRHEHRFAHDGGVTRMFDIVDFRLPFGLLGAIVDVVIARYYVRHLIDVRNLYIKKAGQTRWN